MRRGPIRTGSRTGALLLRGVAVLRRVQLVRGAVVLRRVQLVRGAVVLRRTPLLGAALLCTALLGTALLLVAAAPAAAASRAASYEQIQQIYERDNGIPPCEFTSQQLAAALNQGIAYNAQYFGDFTAAVQSTLTAQALGRCSTRGREQAARAAITLPLGQTPAPPNGITAPTGGSLPLPLLLLLVLGLGGGLVAATVAGARIRGWEPVWGPYVRHSWGEAEYRLTGAWDEFRDWLRSGRERSAL